MSMIHPNAIIQDGAVIGENVVIDANAFVSSRSKIGDNTHIMHGAVIDGDTTIGAKCKIFYNSVVGSVPQDLKYRGEDTRLVIGDNTTVREFAQINSGTQGGGGVTKIGSNCYIMGHVHIAHDCIIDDNVIVVNYVALAGHVEVGKNSVIGGMSAVHQFVHIGEYAMVAGGSMVSQDIPHYCLCEGNRAHLRGLNLVGLRRNLKDKQEIMKLKEAYKKMFKSGKPMQESAQELLQTDQSEYVKKFAAFVSTTQRGIPVKGNKNE